MYHTDSEVNVYMTWDKKTKQKQKQNGQNDDWHYAILLNPPSASKQFFAFC